MNTVELRHLQALVALTEEGTFTDAALRLGVTQSAVSRTITTLEQLVAVRLVERTTRSVALTDAGVRCYRAAVLALGAMDAVIDAAQGRTRPLRLGYVWSALGRHTSEVLRRWRAEQPDVPLEVHRVDERAAGLHRHAVDVAVLRGMVDEPGTTVRRIFTEPRLAAVPIGHELAAQPSVALAELSRNTVLLTANGTTTLDLWPPDRRPATLRVDNIDEWITEIAGGLAVGVTAESTAAQHAHPGVRFIPVRDAAPVAVHLVWLTGLVHPSVETFAALVSRVVAEG